MATFFFLLLWVIDLRNQIGIVSESVRVDQEKGGSAFEGDRPSCEIDPDDQKKKKK